jgi:hypothetical protein
VFRSFVANAAEARVLAALVGAIAAAVLAPASGYGTAMREAFHREIEFRGGRIAAEIAYPPGQVSFGREAAELARAGFSDLFVPDAARSPGGWPHRSTPVLPPR